MSTYRALINGSAVHGCAIPPIHSIITPKIPPMPDNPTYLHRLPSILVEAKSPKPIPFFRRCDVEALFGLKRRQAINLMHRIGAVRVSQEIAIPQRDLGSWLLLLLDCTVG